MPSSSTGLFVLSFSGVLAAAASAHARPADSTYGFKIPAGTLTQGVNALALQSGRQALFSPRLATGKQTDGVIGRYTLDQALDRLLAGTGLSYRIVASRLILIVRTPAPPRPPPRIVAAAPNATSQGDGAPVDTLIVTGGLAEAPPNVERLTTRALVNNGVFDLRDTARLTPSMNAVPTGAGQLKLALRGVYGAGEATTPLYFADLPISGASGTTSDPGLVTPDLALVDIDHVDVLRGPQGVERGSGAIGGELRITPAEPVLGETQLVASARAGLIQGGSPSGQVYVVGNAPIGTDAAVRIVAYSRHTGGYVSNLTLGVDDTNQETTTGLRLGLKMRASDDLEVKGFALYQERRIDDISSWSRDLGPYRSDRHTLNGASHRIGVVGTTVRQEIGSVTVTNSAGYYDWTLGRRIDSTQLTESLASDPEGCVRYFDLESHATCSPAQAGAFSAYAVSRAPSALVQSTTIQALVEELRAEGGDARTRWTTGIFVERRAEQSNSATMVINPATGDVLDSAGYTGLRTIASRFDQIAAYGEAVRAVGDRLTLTAGLRYAYTDRSASSDVLIPNVISGSTNSTPTRSVSGTRATIKLRADWRLDSGGLYVQATQGARPGGVNTTPDPAQTRTTFAPDSLWNYEIGARRSWFDGALALEAAAFLIEVSDMQFAASTPNGAFGYVTNIGSAQIKGLEAAAKVDLGGGLSLEFNGAATDARLTGEDPGRAQLHDAQAGDRIPNIPSYRHAFALVYRRPLADGAGLTLTLQNEYRSAITSEFRKDDPLFMRSRAYAINNLIAAWDRGPLGVLVALNNILDARAADFANSSVLSRDQIFSVPPRNLSVTVHRAW